jgi:hypothetical protein
MSVFRGFRSTGRVCALWAVASFAAPPALGQETPAAAAPAPTPAEQNLERRKSCVANHERSQVQRNDGDLLGARSAALACSQAECPSIVRNDCLQWFAEVDRDLASVVVTARAGADDVDATIYVDGQKQPAEAYGRTLELNPGRHHFRMEQGDGKASQERDVMLAPRDKERQVLFQIAAPPPPVSTPTPTPPAQPQVPTERPVPMVTFVLGGAALALAAGGGVLGALSLSDRSARAKPASEGGCSPYCTDDDVSSVKSKAIGADVLFGLSVATGAAALLTYLWRPEVPITAGTRAPALGVGVARGAGLVSIGGHF